MALLPPDPEVYVVHPGGLRAPTTVKAVLDWRQENVQLSGGPAACSLRQLRLRDRVSQCHTLPHTLSTFSFHYRLAQKARTGLNLRLANWTCLTLLLRRTRQVLAALGVWPIETVLAMYRFRGRKSEKVLSLPLTCQSRRSDARQQELNPITLRRLVSWVTGKTIAQRSIPEARNPALAA